MSATVNFEIFNENGDQEKTLTSNDINNDLNEIDILKPENRGCIDIKNQTPNHITNSWFKISRFEISNHKLTYDNEHDKFKLEEHKQRKHYSFIIHTLYEYFILKLTFEGNETKECEIKSFVTYVDKERNSFKETISNENKPNSNQEIVFYKNEKDGLIEQGNLEKVKIPKFYTELSKDDLINIALKIFETGFDSTVKTIQFDKNKIRFNDPYYLFEKHIENETISLESNTLHGPGGLCRIKKRFDEKEKASILFNLEEMNIPVVFTEDFNKKETQKKLNEIDRFGKLTNQFIKKMNSLDYLFNGSEFYTIKKYPEPDNLDIVDLKCTTQSMNKLENLIKDVDEDVNTFSQKLKQSIYENNEDIKYALNLIDKPNKNKDKGYRININKWFTLSESKTNFQKHINVGGFKKLYVKERILENKNQKRFVVTAELINMLGLLCLQNKLDELISSLEEKTISFS